MKPFRLTRRTLLRGAAAAVALPPLEAMMDSRGRYFTGTAQAQTPPVRVFTYFFPNGRPDNASLWTPAADGTAWQSTACLDPIMPLKADVNILTNIDNTAGKMVNGAHEPGCGSWATGTPVVRSASGSWGGYQATGPSFDQVLAQRLGSGTRFPSLAVSAYNGTRLPGYLRMISWADAGKPIVPDNDPRNFFDKLFNATGGGNTAAPGVNYNRSVLDYVLGRVSKLQTKLGATDKQRLDQHLQNIRELEKQLTAPPTASCRVKPTPIDPTPATFTFKQRGKLLTDLLVYAIKCDLTHYGSFMYGSGIGTDNLVPAPDNFHSVSHNGPADAFARLVAAHVGEFAYFLQQLKDIPEAGGNVLDNSLIYFAGELANGAAHSKANMPIILAGKGGGKVQTGRHIRYPQGKHSTNELFLAIMNIAGASVTKFGVDGNAPLPGL